MCSATWIPKRWRRGGSKASTLFRRACRSIGTVEGIVRLSSLGGRVIRIFRWQFVRRLSDAEPRSQLSDARNSEFSKQVDCARLDASLFCQFIEKGRLEGDLRQKKRIRSPV